MSWHCQEMARFVVLIEFVAILTLGPNTSTSQQMKSMRTMIYNILCPSCWPIINCIGIKVRVIQEIIDGIRIFCNLKNLSWLCYFNCILFIITPRGGKVSSCLEPICFDRLLRHAVVVINIRSQATLNIEGTERPVIWELLNSQLAIAPINAHDLLLNPCR